VKIPWVRRDLCGTKILVMEWIDGIRCTDPQAIRDSGVNVDEFIRWGWGCLGGEGGRGRQACWPS
jgi:predicted unusual protein kinase regulating ubiquinone biosynthesis (AarF/ABC1/UbiB family)